jgi:hypothetical protein
MGYLTSLLLKHFLNEITFEGKYIYKVQGPFVNIVNVKCITGFARYLEFTTKILNL